MSDKSKTSNFISFASQILSVLCLILLCVIMIRNESRFLARESRVLYMETNFDGLRTNRGKVN